MEQINNMNLKQRNQEKENRGNAKGEQPHSELRRHWREEQPANSFPHTKSRNVHRCRIGEQSRCGKDWPLTVLSVCTVEKDYGLLMGRRNKGMHSISNCQMWTPHWAKLQVSLMKAAVQA